MSTKGKKQGKKAAAKKPGKATAKKAAARKRKSTVSAESKADTTVSREARHQMIAEAAYKIAAMRKFQNADPVGDWLTAEREIDSRLVTGADT